MLKEYFQQYLFVSIKGKSQNPENSIRHYIGAINTINSLLKKSDFPIDNVFKITTVNELNTIMSFLKHDSEFLHKDSIGHNMYSAAFRHFYKFACEDEWLIKKDEVYKMDMALPPPRRVIRDGHEDWERNHIIVEQAIKSADYYCECNKEHLTFTSEHSHKNFTEGHHLIALCKQKFFSNSLDVYANIVSLCPICHKLLHYGVYNEKVFALEKIYVARAKRLKNSGIDISVKDLIELSK